MNKIDCGDPATPFKIPQILGCLQPSGPCTTQMGLDQCPHSLILFGGHVSRSRSICDDGGFLQQKDGSSPDISNKETPRPYIPFHFGEVFLSREGTQAPHARGSEP